MTTQTTTVTLRADSSTDLEYALESLPNWLDEHPEYDLGDTWAEQGEAGGHDNVALKFEHDLDPDELEALLDELAEAAEHYDLTWDSSHTDS